MKTDSTTIKRSVLRAVFLMLVSLLIFFQMSNISIFLVEEVLGRDASKAQTDIPNTDSKMDKDKQASIKNSTSNEWAKTSANPQLDLDYVRLLLMNMNKQERDKILAESELFKQVVQNEANKHSLASAAIVNGLATDRNVTFLMRRGAENILREIYLNRLIIDKLPPDYPSTEKISEYYNKNKSQFVLPKRTHVWQIFFANPKDEEQMGAVKKKMESIAQDIRKGRLDFSNVALLQSEHEQTKQFGGYMGLLKITELLPEIKAVLLQLKEGEISKVVKTDAGFHILKRGKILDEEALTLQQVASKIKKSLLKQASTELRNAIYLQARKEFPQDLTEKKLEEWRLKLRMDTIQ